MITISKAIGDIYKWCTSAKRSSANDAKKPDNLDEFEPLAVQREGSPFSQNASDASGFLSPYQTASENSIPAMPELHLSEATPLLLGRKDILEVPPLANDENKAKAAPFNAAAANYPDTQLPNFNNLTRNLVDKVCNKQNIKTGAAAIVFIALLAAISYPTAKQNYDCNKDVVAGNDEHGPLLGTLYPWAEYLLQKVLKVGAIPQQTLLALGVIAGVSSATTNVITTVRAYINLLLLAQWRQVFDTMKYGSKKSQYFSIFTFISALFATVGSGVAAAADVQGDQKQVIIDILTNTAINGAPFISFSSKVDRRIQMANLLADTDHLLASAEFEIPAGSQEAINELLLEKSFDAFFNQFHGELPAYDLEANHEIDSEAYTTVFNAIMELSQGLGDSNGNNEAITATVVNFSSDLGHITAEPKSTLADTPVYTKLDNPELDKHIQQEEKASPTVENTLIKSGYTTVRSDSGSGSGSNPDLDNSEASDDEINSNNNSIETSSEESDIVELQPENPQPANLQPENPKPESDTSSSSDAPINNKTLNPPKESANDDAASEYLSPLQKLIAEAHAFTRELAKPHHSPETLLAPLNKINQLLNDASLNFLNEKVQAMKDAAGDDATDAILLNANIGGHSDDEDDDPIRLADLFLQSNRSFNQAQYLLEGHVCKDNLKEFYLDIKQQVVQLKTLSEEELIERKISVDSIHTKIQNYMENLPTPQAQRQMALFWFREIEIERGAAAPTPFLTSFHRALRYGINGAFSLAIAIPAWYCVYFPTVFVAELLGADAALGETLGFLFGLVGIAGRAGTGAFSWDAMTKKLLHTWSLIKWSYRSSYPMALALDFGIVYFMAAWLTSGNCGANMAENAYAAFNTLLKNVGLPALPDSVVALLVAVYAFLFAGLSNAFNGVKCTNDMIGWGVNKLNATQRNIDATSTTLARLREYITGGTVPGNHTEKNAVDLICDIFPEFKARLDESQKPQPKASYLSRLTCGFFDKSSQQAPLEKMAYRSPTGLPRSSSTDSISSFNSNSTDSEGFAPTPDAVSMGNRAKNKASSSSFWSWMDCSLCPEPKDDGLVVNHGMNS